MSFDHEMDENSPRKPLPYVRRDNFAIVALGRLGDEVNNNQATIETIRAAFDVVQKTFLDLCDDDFRTDTANGKAIVDLHQNIIRAISECRNLKVSTDGLPKLGHFTLNDQVNRGIMQVTMQCRMASVVDAKVYPGEPALYSEPLVTTEFPPDRAPNCIIDPFLPGVVRRSAWVMVLFPGDNVDPAFFKQ